MIELRTNNLYASGAIEEFNNGEKSLIREPVDFVIDSTDNSYHIITKFDRLDLIAYQFYGTIIEDASKYWWVIADVNEITNPLDLKDLVGTRIVIPDILKVLLQL